MQVQNKLTDERFFGFMQVRLSRLLDTFLFMTILPEQDTRMSEFYFSHLEVFIDKKFYGQNVRNGTGNTIFIAFLYSLMSYLNIKTVNALHKLIVRQ